MHKKKNCNTPTVSVAVTPAQQMLLQELSINEIPDLIAHLKTIHYNGTYELQEPQRSDLIASQHVLWFIQSLEKIQSQISNTLKTA
jgi:predicted TPR repeat methyltransferase